MEGRNDGNGAPGEYVICNKGGAATTCCEKVHVGTRMCRAMQWPSKTSIDYVSPFAAFLLLFSLLRRFEVSLTLDLGLVSSLLKTLRLALVLISKSDVGGSTRLVFLVPQVYHKFSVSAGFHSPSDKKHKTS